MSNHAVRACTGQSRASLYDEITDKIIFELEAGRIPWVQPWRTVAAKAPLALPKNASTARQYSGVNILILWGAVIEHGFTGRSWLTFRRALSLGGHVQNGPRYQACDLFWDILRFLSANTLDSKIAVCEKSATEGA
jgi:antirestriction protein ArdC